MKKITITCADGDAAAIVACVAEHALSLHLETLGQTGTKKTRKSRVVSTRAGAECLRVIPEDGSVVAGTSVDTHMRSLGYGNTTAAARLSDLVREGLIVREGTRGAYSYRRVVS